MTINIHMSKIFNGPIDESSMHMGMGGGEEFYNVSDSLASCSLAQRYIVLAPMSLCLMLKGVRIIIIISTLNIALTCHMCAYIIIMAHNSLAFPWQNSGYSTACS